MSTDEPSPPTIATASSITTLKTALSTLQTNHARLTTHLDALMSSQPTLPHTLSHLDVTHARLASLTTTTRTLHSQKLSPASTTAARLSTAVKRLDTEQRNIGATLVVVEQTATLRACILGINGCMSSAQDWEQAASYVQRAGQIPAAVIESGFAANVVPSAECPEAPGRFLEDARESLCGVFRREFERAVERRDAGGVGRFFKMFPAIGREGVGLEVYGRYVCSGVAERARGRLQQVAKRGKGEQGGWAYVQALTKLFEHIAQVIDNHAGLVQRHYGSHTMITVMSRLHSEADVQGGIVLDSWWDERGLERKLTDVKSYAYTFLVQSFLPVQRQGTPRSQSPANKDAARRMNEEHEEGGVDMKEVDAILGEITGMLGHWALYVRFLSARAAEAEVGDQVEGQQQETQLPPLSTPAFLETSALPKKIAKTLTDPFSTFSTYFLRRSVEKSFQLEESPQGLTLNLKKPLDTNSPPITSAVDDVMYMVNQIIQRTLAASQATMAMSVIATVGRVLGSDFIGMIQRKLRDESYPKAAVQGAMPPEDKIIAFLVLLNNLDVATEYMKRIVESQAKAGPQENGHTNGDHEHHSAAGKSLADLFPMGNEADNVRNTLMSLETGFTTKATDLIHDGVSVAFSQIVKARIRPFLAELFREMDYTVMSPSDDEEDSDDPQRALKSRMQAGWEALVKPLKRIMSARNAGRFMHSAVSYLSGVLEKRIWSYQGRVSEFGAVRLEKDVGDISNVAVRGEAFKLREVFNRCTQIVAILNMEEEEWDEVNAYSEQGGEEDEGTWALNKSERERARGILNDKG